MGNTQEEGFLDLYMKFTAKQESPELFHLWTSITVLAAALGRKCYLDKGYYRLYPNIFCILVAGAARCRKSTAINIGVSLLHEIETPNVRVIGGKITPEQFVKEIAESARKDEESGQIISPSTLVHSSELSVFLTKQSYGEPLIYILTDLFDCPDVWHNKTKTKGVDELRNVFICILAGTTPDGLAEGIPQSALKEGFGSRILYVFQRDTPRRNPFPRLTPEEKEMRARLLIILADRAQMAGEFTLTERAQDWYIDWYDKFMSEAPPDKRLEGVYGRKHDHLLRIAMILSASYGMKVIDLEQCEGALMALNSLEAQHVGAFEVVGGDAFTNFIEQAKAYMRRFKRMSHSTLLQKLYPCNAEIYNKVVIATLIQSGFIRRDPDKQNWYELLE